MAADSAAMSRPENWQNRANQLLAAIRRCQKISDGMVDEIRPDVNAPSTKLERGLSTALELALTEVEELHTWLTVIHGRIGQL